tara:strand:- start:5412 stop:7361 length:1950 start_codon:yes stop_codon:yes gene_type:complete
MNKMADYNPSPLDEHAPRNPDSPSGAGVYAPTSEEKKAIKLVEKLFSKAKKHRGQYDSKWIDFYHMFRGKQWKEQRPSFRHSEVINHIFKSIQSTVPIQMDARPRFEFLPEEPADMKLAEILNEAAEADWIRKGWGEQLLETVYDSNIYGTGLSKMVFDPNADMKRGDLEYSSIDPLYCYPDPDARDVNKKCWFFVYAEPMDVAKIKRRYPDKKEFLKGDLTDLAAMSKTDIGAQRFRSPVDNQTILTETGTGGDSAINKDKALLITCWLSPEMCEDDFDEKDVSEKDPNTGEVVPKFAQMARYPNGRKIVTCNGVLLEDTQNGYDDAEIPYQRYANYILPREFWGISEVEQLEGPQKTFNKMVSFALDVMTLMGNPIWMVPSASGVDPENLTTRPGLVVEYDGEAPPSRVEGTQLQPYVLQMIDRMGNWFDAVSGSQDVTRGVNPTGVTAASAISSLQEAAQTRIRQKARNLDGYLQHVGQQWLSRTFQFRTAPMMYRLTGKDGLDKYFRMHVEDYEITQPELQPHPETGEPVPVQVPTGEMGKRVIVQPYGQNGLMNPEDMRQYETRAKFDVRVSTGSSLPFAKAEKEQKLLNYFDRGIIDEEEVLKGSDYPNWQAVLQRVEQKKMQAAQAQAAAKAGGAPQQAPMG